MPNCIIVIIYVTMILYLSKYDCMIKMILKDEAMQRFNLVMRIAAKD
jgi:hypothetical protein